VGAEGKVYEVSPYAFTVTRDLVEQIQKVRGDFPIKDVDRNGNGLITEDEIWDHFTFQVQQDREAFDEISASLRRKHPQLMRFMADRDLQAQGRSTDRIRGEFQPGMGDMRELVQSRLRATADELGKPVEHLTDLERFNTAVTTFGDLGIRYDQLSGGDLVVQLARNRDANGTHSASEVFEKQDTPALCLEQSYLMANLLREAGLPAQVNVVNSTEPGTMRAWATHNTVSVKLDGQQHDIEPQSARYAKSSFLGEVGSERRRARMSGDDMLQTLSERHRSYHLSRPLNDKEAMAIGFSNTAWFDFTRVIRDEELTPERRAALLARGRDNIALARQMSGNAIEVPAIDVLGDLAAYSVSRRTRDLQAAEAKVDRYLAQPHWSDVERKWLLSMKEEAVARRGGDTGPVRDTLARLGNDIPFVYENALL
jgi:hypothetical protein